MKGRLEKANWCRLYLQIITISDLADEKGREIPGDRMDRKWQADSSLIWPTIPRPPANYWEAFCWYMYRAFTTTPPQRLAQRATLRTTLGKWIPAVRHIRHPYYQTATEAFRRNGSTFQAYNEPTKALVFQANGLATKIPHDAHPISARFDDDCLWTSEPYSFRKGPMVEKARVTKQVVASNRPDMAGSDGSVDIASGDRGPNI